MYRSFRYSFLFIISIILSSSPLYASNTIERLPRTSASTPTASIDWSVIGGAGQCYGTTDYPNNGDGFQSWWITGVHAAQGTGALYPIHAEPGTYTFTCTDSSYSSYSDTSYLVVKPCSDHGPGYSWNGSLCFNPVPSVTITPTSNQEILMGESVAYSSVATDAGNDVTGHYFNVLRPNGDRNVALDWNWGNVNPDTFYGSVSPGSYDSFAGSASHTKNVTFTPSRPGTYRISFSALDNNASRWTASGEYTLTAYCPGGTLWNGTTCQSTLRVGNFVYTATSMPDVDYNETATLSWDGISNATSCTLNGGQYSAVDVGTGATGVRTTLALTGNTTYSLSCVGYGDTITRTLTVPVASGSLSAAPTVCTIAKGYSSCLTNLTWTTSDMSSPRLTNGSDGTLSLLPNGSGVQFSVPRGTSVFALKNGSITHASLSVNATCDSASEWNGVICRDRAESQPTTASLNGGTCYIALGASTCSITVAWSLPSSVGVVTVRNAADNTIVATGNQGSENTTFNYGNTVLNLQDNGIIRATETFVATCVLGTQWNGSACVITAGVATGSMNESTCIISTGASSCSMTVTWTTNNASNVEVTRAYDSNSVLGSGNSGSLSRTFPSGSYTLDLRADGAILDSGLFRATCEAGSNWNGTTCILSNENATIVINAPASSCIIPVGQSTCSVTVTWESTGGDTTVTNETTGTTVSSSNTGTQPVTVSHGNNTLTVTDGTTILDTEVVTGICASGGWDTVSSTCVNPSVTSAAVTGQYGYGAGGNGTILVTCGGGANGYRITRDGIAFSSGAYSGSPIPVMVNISGNYAIHCIYGTYESAPPLTRYYSAASSRPSPAIILTASPRTIPKYSNATLNWTIQHPTAACNLDAITICGTSGCTQDQTNENTRVRGKIARTERIDAQGLSGLLGTLNTRTIEESLREIPDDRVDTDWKTTGVKTLTLKYSTEFTLTCGASVSQAAKVLITTTGER